jgi:hypothetical protein
MDPISDAIAAIDVREPGEKLSYRAAQEKLGVDKETLRRRHKGLSRSNAEEAESRMLLNP